MPILLIFILTNFIFLSAAVAQNEPDSDDADFAAYNNFDFIAGKKTIFFDDFSEGLGKWSLVDLGSSEETKPAGIMKISGETISFFKTPQKGIFYPTKIRALPEECTIEFDMYADVETMSEMEGGLNVILAANVEDRDEFSIHFDENPQIQLDVHPSADLLYCIAIKEAGNEDRILSTRQIKNGWNIGKTHRISISRNQQHIKLFINEKKFVDLPQGLPKKGNYTLLLSTNLWGDGLYFTNFKISEDIVEKPSVMVKEGKFVTNAIYFDINSATIKPESWSGLNQAAQAIQSVKGKIMIIGHTDSDGNDATNLSLSKKRAESVKQALVNHFAIEDARLMTDGKGESVPVDTNQTSEGKANNRRVEFVRQNPGQNE